jgi:hypothetical protein
MFKRRDCILVVLLTLLSGLLIAPHSFSRKLQLSTLYYHDGQGVFSVWNFALLIQGAQP